MKFLLVLLLQVAAPNAARNGVQNDVMELRKFLGADFASAMKLLASTNTFLLNNVQRSSPQQADRLRAEMAQPSTLGEKQNVLPLTINNAGRGIVTTLFEEDFIAEQMNLVFCPAAPRRVVAVQVLFDERSALRDTLFLFQRIYQMPAPSKFETYKPAMKYNLTGVTYDAESRWTKAAGAPVVTVFDLGADAEAIYQPAAGQRLITGQFWVGKKDAAKTCTAPIVTTSN